ncbi:putative RNA polymerase sigma-32 factor [Cricetulus griseus]|uniref:Putative RNA polymerase sigma-32 factor n=1 Tax=Cricetulus griseus TaxID=10029 RepID=A0A061HUT0_CRIGR|nr:putative RNA polymerase sigma-32 factor [Cricetulus griseus]
MIKPGTTNEQKKLFYNLRKEQRRLEEMGITADAATIAQNLDVSEEDVIEMDGRLRNDICLDGYISQNDDDERKPLSECISSSIEEQPDIVAENKNYHDMIRNKLSIFAMKLKSDRQRDILYKRIIADEPLTLQELGDSFHITKERTRQIEEEIVVRLKKYLRGCIDG